MIWPVARGLEAKHVGAAIRFGCDYRFLAPGCCGFFLETTLLFLDTVKSVKSRNNSAVEVVLRILPDALRPKASYDHIDIRTRRDVITVRPTWIGEGFPADVRAFLEENPNHSPTANEVVVARRMSKGAVELLRHHHVSWADTAGFAEIAIEETVYVYRQRPSPLPARALGEMSWSTSADNVAEFVLSRVTELGASAPRIWNGVDRIADIAEATGVSPSQVAKALLAFDEQGYTAKFGPARGPMARREIVNHRRMLSDWASRFRRTRSNERQVQFHLLSRDPNHWQELVRESLTSIPWAVSGWLGAERTAPFVTTIPDTIVYVSDTNFEEAVSRLMRQPEVTSVEQGGRIILRSAPDFVIDLGRESQGARLVSPVRLYADLIRTGGRGLDAAEHLREVSIGF